MKMLKKTFAAVLVLLICVSTCSCGTVPEGLDRTARELVEKSFEISLAVYGEGLKTDPERGQIGAIYVAVDENEKFQSIEEMKNAASEVFTEGYAAVLSVTAFDGVHYEGSTVRKRYVESDGIMYADTSYDTQVEPRTPDYDSIEIINANKHMAQIKINMINADKTVSEEKFMMRFENGEWKLDGCVL